MLNEADWLAVGLAYRKIRKRYYRILTDQVLRHQKRIEPDLSDHIAQGFATYDPWQCCVVGLAAEELNQMLFAANATLDRVWKEATYSWSKARRQNAISIRSSRTSRSETRSISAGRSNALRDTRVPTFIVIDEAHNFAPEEPNNELQARVSDKIAQIASEGRKYGLYLILATQRPKKLRKGLLSECENAALLRIQSKVERSYAGETLGVGDIIERVGASGSGVALLHGRWVPESMSLHTAPVRTVLGGGDIDPQFWTQPQQVIDSKMATVPLRQYRFEKSKENENNVLPVQTTSVVLGVTQATITASDHEAAGFLTANIGRPTGSFTATGKLFPKFVDVPQHLTAKLVSAPPTAPEVITIAATGTTFDFNVITKPKQVGITLPVGVYKFEYQAKCFVPDGFGSP